MYIIQFEWSKYDLVMYLNTKGSNNFYAYDTSIFKATKFKSIDNIRKLFMNIIEEVAGSVSLVKIENLIKDMESLEIINLDCLNLTYDSNNIIEQSTIQRFKEKARRLNLEYSIKKILT